MVFLYFISSEERHLRANDREFNLSFNYAVSRKIRIFFLFNFFFLEHIVSVFLMCVLTEQCHQDLQVQRVHIPPSQSV